MHVAGLALYDTAGLDDDPMPRVRELIESRLHLAPPFRRRLVEVPFGLHHPVWIEDPDFDLDHHLRHIAVPPPGAERELAELAAHLVSLPLDRSRPLWEMWVIEGLEGIGPDTLATLTKVHHAAIDGVAGNELTVALFDLSPEVAEVPAPAQPWRPDHVPSDFELVGYATNSLVRQPVKLVKALRQTAATALNVRSVNRQSQDDPPPSPFSAPRTSINAALTSHRSYAMRTLSLPDVKHVKNTFGTTVNDVVLALCSGALRSYFDARSELLDGPLVAMVPMSVRTESEQTTGGNRVTSMLTSLASDLDDPVDRLLQIHTAMRAAKEQTNAIGADMLTDWAEFAAPAIFSLAVRLYSRTRLADRHRPLFNVTISNVPGPPFPLYSAGAPLLHNYPMGPIFDGAGLNMTVMSYLDNLDFGLLACPDLVDDVWEIADGLQGSLDALVDAASAIAGRAAPPEGSGEPRATASPKPSSAPAKGTTRTQGTRKKASSARPARQASGGRATKSGGRATKSGGAGGNGQASGGRSSSAARTRAATARASASDS